MKIFEYKTIKVKSNNAWGASSKPEDIDKELNALGRQGWELTTTYHILQYFYYTFKRESKLL